MQIHYFIREYSEGVALPEVHLFTDEEECRRTMIAEAYEAMEQNPSYVCIPGTDSPLKREQVPADVTGLDVEWDTDGFDCFRMGVQELKAPLFWTASYGDMGLDVLFHDTREAMEAQAEEDEENHGHSVDSYTSGEEEI